MFWVALTWVTSPPESFVIVVTSTCIQTACAGEYQKCQCHIAYLSHPNLVYIIYRVLHLFPIGFRLNLLILSNSYHFHKTRWNFFFIVQCVTLQSPGHLLYRCMFQQLSASCILVKGIMVTQKAYDEWWIEKLGVILEPQANICFHACFLTDVILY